MTCVILRDGQSTDAPHGVPPCFHIVGRDATRDGRKTTTLYRCECGQLWSAWWIGDGQVWGREEERLSRQRRRAGWRRDLVDQQPRWWRLSPKSGTLLGTGNRNEVSECR